MFDVMYRVLPDGEWRRYGVALPKARAEAFAKTLETSRNGVHYAAAAVSLDRPAALETPEKRSIAA